MEFQPRSHGKSHRAAPFFRQALNRGQKSEANHRSSLQAGNERRGDSDSYSQAAPSRRSRRACVRAVLAFLSIYPWRPHFVPPRAGLNFDHTLGRGAKRGFASTLALIVVPPPAGATSEKAPPGPANSTSFYYIRRKLDAINTRI